MISIKSARAEELLRVDLIALMTNDSRRSVTRRRPRIGSGEAAAPHSTPWGCPFASPRNRPDVASFHVPHPHVYGPQSRWDRCTSLHIRGARGPLRWKLHHRPLYWSPPLRLALGLANEINARDGPANERNRMLPALHNFTHDVPSTNRDTRISHEIKVRRKGPTTVGKSITRDAP